MKRDDEKVGFFFLWWWWLWIPLYIRQRIQVKLPNVPVSEFDNAKAAVVSELDESVDPTKECVLKTIEVANSRRFSAVCTTKGERTCKHCIESDIMIDWIEQKTTKQRLCIQCEFDKDLIN